MKICLKYIFIMFLKLVFSTGKYCTRFLSEKVEIYKQDIYGKWKKVKWNKKLIYYTNSLYIEPLYFQAVLQTWGDVLTLC